MMASKKRPREENEKESLDDYASSKMSDYESYPNDSDTCSDNHRLMRWVM